MQSAQTGLEAFDRHRSLDFVVKVAERCNIACSYCYFFFRGDESFKKHPPYITSEAIESFTAMLRRLAERDGLKSVRIGLHGGEPLMTPRHVLRAFCESVKALEKDGTLESVMLNMQTNAMLVDEEWLDFMTEFEIGAGVSIDGRKELNDAGRIDKKGRGTYDRAVAGYQRLFDAAKAGRIPAPGLLGVAMAGQSGKDSFEHNSEHLQTRSMNFLLPDYSHEDRLDGDYVESIERFLIDAFRAWTAKGDAGVRVRFIDEIIAPLSSDEVAAVFSVSARDYRHILTVSSNGEVSPEDTIKPLDDRFRALRHADEVNGLTDLLGHPAMQEIGRAREAEPAACRSCEWWGICRGGNITNRFSKASGFDNPSIFCDALKSIYLEVASWLVEQGIDPADLERRLDIARGERLAA